jgi:hypothetical protein
MLTTVALTSVGFEDCAKMLPEPINANEHVAANRSAFMNDSRV